MKIGNLRQRIVLQKKRITEDELKQQAETWEGYAYVWASIEPLSGREYFAAKQVNAEKTTKITIRHLKDVTSDMRVVFNGRVFEIESVIDPKERHESIILMCREVLA